jgi:hypothetical protein
MMHNASGKAASIFTGTEASLTPKKAPSAIIPKAVAKHEPNITADIAHLQILQ